MSNAQIESDPLFQLLTDALRAGPGSAEWEQAVVRVREQGAGESDEYKLLLQAREDLESGREYKSVAAGPGFTRKLMAQIDDHQQGEGRRNSLPTATIIGLVALLVMGIALGVFFYFLKTAPVTGEGQGLTADELRQLPFQNQRTAVDFATLRPPKNAAANPGFEGEPELPPGWETIGGLPLSMKGSLKPLESDAKDGGFAGGGVMAPIALPAGEPFEIDVQFLPGTPKSDVITQIFVTDDPAISSDRGTTGSELNWLAQGGEQKVLVQGQTVGAALPLAKAGDSMHIRIVVDRTLAVIEADKQPIWSGEHRLSADQPRRVGVRFLRPAGKGTDVPAIQSIRISKRGG